MENSLLVKHASLERSNNIKETLTWKMEQIKEAGAPVDTSLADYIAFSVDNLESQKTQLKLVKAEISEREKHLIAQIERIKEDGATFLLENGVDRLDGLICSSITVSEAKEKTSRLVETEEFILNISQEELEELLIGLGKAERKTVTVEKVSKASPAKLRINKRKIALSEVVDG